MDSMIQHIRDEIANVLNIRWLVIFSARELSLLVSGEEGDLDIEDLRENCVFHLRNRAEEELVFFYLCPGHVFNSQ